MKMHDLSINCDFLHQLQLSHCHDFFALNSETAAMKWINSLNSQYTELNTATSRFTDSNLPIHVAFSFKLNAKA